ncbi:hypothetical protein KGF56_003429 [Candida oxycetoniae]|uniref:U3 small nucleolar RNA-associated protein 11 n=1 Tax=Candida oxycetoniae TaxID=497107 RepID=A0AAI9SW23_9ASCO|nr:uncharacterized protein KGF56_003429 [Candida oxycetoniae]KAI3403794.1 hypothetical protein KGF56_003429 [Candida oxycetoniae]
MTKLVHNVQKKQHRERSQKTSRARYGLLEKKKDYKLRAADYHKKQAALKALKEKAKSHNPDEYFHAMTKRKTDDKGILIADRGNEALSVDQVKLLKTQDINYIRTMRMQELNKIKKEQEMKLFQGSGKHTIFVDSNKEQADFKPHVYFDTDEALLNNKENRLRREQLFSNTPIVGSSQGVSSAQKDKSDEKKLKQYKLLQRRIAKEKELKEVEEIMQINLEKMKSGSKKKIANNGKTYFKWKNQRKR